MSQEPLPTWDELRVDTRFCARRAEPTELVEVWRRAALLPGWFTVDDCGHFALALGLQKAAGITGDLLEIGCYHGRSAAVLAHFLADDEALIICDLFDARPTEYALPPRAADVEANLRRVHPALGKEQLVIHAGPSDTLSLEGRSVRLAHIDGGHEEAVALGDLQLAARALLPGGLCVVDDFHHPDFPGVTAAVERFLDESRALAVVADLHRHGALGRKLYLRRGDGDV